ncbi:MAG: hypothetical protein JWN04_1601 [Myxococcaceae bacterium]|nr:hypothetical protein [Myxococcaceae bacterium]
MNEETPIVVGGPPQRIRASFTISGDALGPDAISAIVGALPDRAFRKGDLGKHGIPHRTGIWKMSVVASPGQAVPELVDCLLARIPDPKGGWAQLAAKFKISLNLMVTISGENQDFCLSASQVARLAAVGASIWIDIYADLS